MLGPWRTSDIQFRPEQFRNGAADAPEYRHVLPAMQACSRRHSDDDDSNPAAPVAGFREGGEHDIAHRHTRLSELSHN